MLDTALCILHFLRCNERVSHSTAQLGNHGIIHCLVLIAEQDGTESHIVINVFIAVDIPDMPVFSVVDIDRRDPLDVRLRPFAVQLASRKDILLRLFPQFL